MANPFQGNFVVAQDAKIVIYPASDDEATVRGLNRITLPLGFDMQTTTIQEFGRTIDLQVPSGATYPPLSCSGYMTIGDPTQVLLRQWAVNSTQIQDIRFYCNDDDFAALDLVNDADACYMVGSFTAPSAGKSEAFSFNVDFFSVGTSILFDKHHHEASDTVTGAELTFTADSGSGAKIVADTVDFAAAGFEAGMTIIIDNATTAANNGYFKILSVSTVTITLTDDYDLTSEDGVAATNVHGGA